MATPPSASDGRRGPIRGRLCPLVSTSSLIVQAYKTSDDGNCGTCQQSVSSKTSRTAYVRGRSRLVPSCSSCCVRDNGLRTGYMISPLACAQTLDGFGCSVLHQLLSQGDRARLPEESSWEQAFGSGLVGCWRCRSWAKGRGHQQYKLPRRMGQLEPN